MECMGCIMLGSTPYELLQCLVSCSSDFKANIPDFSDFQVYGAIVLYSLWKQRSKALYSVVNAYLHAFLSRIKNLFEEHKTRGKQEAATEISECKNSCYSSASALDETEECHIRGLTILFTDAAFQMSNSRLAGP